MSFTPGPGTTYLLTSTQPIPSGTANGVLYLNGSKVVTSGSALTFDGTDMGVGGAVESGIKLNVFGAVKVQSAQPVYYMNSDNTNNAQITNAGATGVSNGQLAFTLGGVGEAMRLTSTGLGIGTNNPGAKLDVRNGYIVSGTGASTDGTKILGGYYTTGHLTTFGSEYSNGSPVIGYGVWPSTSAAASFVSATTINVQRGAYTILGANHVWYGGDAQTVAIDSPVTTSERMRLDTFGNLGLGVTPSGWSTSNSQRAFQVGPVAALSSLDAGGGNRQVNLSNNAIDFNGVPIYLASDFATVYRQLQGTHQWHIAPSGTAGNPISFTQAMTLDASGNLGVGTSSPGFKLDVVAAGTVTARVQNTTTSADAYFQAQNTVATGLFGVNATGQYMYTAASVPTLFYNTGTEHARITSGGDLLVGTISNTGYGGHVLAKNISDGNALGIINSAASNPYGPLIDFTGAAPNDATRYFLSCEDTGATRATIRSNGGLANYQSNNVDLSDARTKKDIAPAPSYWGKIGALEIVTYKYKDQTHDDVNVGVIAQQVEQVEPVWVDSDGFGEVPEDGIPLKTVYTKDITFAAIKALQEAMARIEQLEARLAAAGI